jgi:hypothetical protein
MKNKIAQSEEEGSLPALRDLSKKKFVVFVAVLRMLTKLIPCILWA